MTWTKRNILIGAVLLAVIVAGGWYLLNPSQTAMEPQVPLVAYELTPRQLQEVEQFLKQEGYDYELREQMIYVAESKQQEILVDMATQGIPSKDK